MSVKSLPVLKAELRNHIFNRNPYRVDQDFHDLFSAVSHYTRGNFNEQPYDDTPITDASYLYTRSLVPHFQRDNNKWTEAMQVAYVENVLKGYRTDLFLYTTKADYEEWGYGKAKVLDGLQRLTAMMNFIGGKFKAFGYTFQELFEGGVISRNMSVGFRIFTFQSDIEAAIHYIQMNRNITHSAGDISRAIEYVNNSFAVELLATRTLEKDIKVDWESDVKLYWLELCQRHGQAVSIRETGRNSVWYTIPVTIHDTKFDLLVGFMSYLSGVGDQLSGWISTKPFYSVKF